MDIIPESKKNISMDATVLSSLMSCARYHDIRFNHRLVSKKGKSNSLEMGSLVHKVLEVYYKHMINGFKRDVAIGQSLAAGQLYIIGCPGCANHVDDTPPPCGHEAGEYPGVSSPEKNEGTVTGWSFALDTCQQYFDFYKNDSFIPLAAEEVRGKVLYEDDDIRVLWKAKFDLIIDNSQIGIMSTDHKSFKQSRHKSTLSSQFTGQCLLLDSRNVMVNKIGLQTSLKIEERLTRELVSFSKFRLDEWKNEILPYYAYKYIQFTETGYWPPDWTHCDTMYGPCMYKEVCQADPNMREEMLRKDFRLAPVWDPRNKDE